MLYFSVTAIWGHMDVMLHALFQCYYNMRPHGCNVTCFISVLLQMGPHSCNVTCFISISLQYGATWMKCYMLYFSVTAIWSHMDVMLHTLFQCYCNMGPHGCNVTCFISVLLQYGATWMQCYMLYFSVTAIWGHMDVMLHALFQCHCNMGPHGCNVTCFISVLLQYGAIQM